MKLAARVGAADDQVHGRAQPPLGIGIAPVDAIDPKLGAMNLGEEIENLYSVMTVVGGEVVYRE